MTHLADLLSDPKDLLKRARAKAPEPARLRKAVAALGEGPGLAHAADDIAVIQERVAAAAHAGSEGLANLSRRDLREGCRVFLYPPCPPGRSPDVGDALISQVVHLQRRAAYLALIDAYLDGFAIGDDDVDRLARALAATAATWPWRETDLWPERFAAFNLLDPADAPIRLAMAMLRADAPPRAVLEAAGLQSDGRRKGGLAEAGFREACGMVAGSAAKSAAPLQDRLIAWGQDGAQALAFPKAWPDFACALFKPWQVEEPPAAHKTVLIDSALAHAGDPRVNEGKWRPVRSAFGEAYDVVVRWLTKASVEQFFDIVSETMVDRPDMWAQRRAFWTQYLKNNAISAAWVAFGADGAERAKRAARTSGDRGLSMFGRLSSGNGRTSQHSALIMTIGDLTVVEWSHNGKCYIWRRLDAGAPKLFQHSSGPWADYEPSELMGAPIDVSHSGYWQGRIASILREHAGVRP
jgi:hypothetical protein